MDSNRFKFLIIQTCVCIVLLISSISYGYAAASAGEISDEVLNEPAESEFNDFDEFDDFDVNEPVEVYDPLKGYNRFMTRVNDHFYVLALRPLAKGYRFIVIEPVRLAIDRVFTNALYPVRFVNNLLQLKVKRAGTETARFLLNTTWGLGGLFDPAKGCMGLEAYPEDFGQTLGFYGVGRGFHIVIPVMGPSNLRDAFGFFPDTLLRPMTYVRDLRATIAVSVVDHFNTMSLYVDQYDALRAEAIDLYVFQRDAYEMRRKKAIKE